MKLSRVVSCVATVVLAAAACSSESSQPAAGAAGDAGTPGFGSSACGSCVQSTCATEVADCGGDPACAARLQCVLACPVAPSGNVDPSCESACPAVGSTTGQQREAALASCRATKAAAACPACGAAPDAGIDAPAEAGPQEWILHQQCSASTETQACAVCEDEHCCTTYQDCLADNACQAYKDCAKDCINNGGTDCWTQCATQHPGGVPHWAARQACILVFCAEPCGGVPLTSCETCTNAHCAEAWVAFQGDPAGYLLWACIDACDGVKSCTDACQQQHPTAAPLFEAYATCSMSKCPAECG